MSTPQTLAVPEGVAATRLETPRGSFAAHVARVDAPLGHVLLVPGWTGSKEDFTQLLPLLAQAGFDAIDAPRGIGAKKTMISCLCCEL